MEEFRERRRQQREKYVVLRFYAKMVSWLSFIGLGVALLFGLLVIVYGEMPASQRFWYGFISAAGGLIYFVLFRAAAEAIYLLFDVARHSRASRELLEKAQSAAGPARPDPAQGG